MAPAAELNHWACLFAERVQVAQAPPAQRLPLPRGGATEGRGPCNAESLEPPSRVGSQSRHFFRGARSLSSGPNPRRNTGGRPPAMAIHSGWKPGLGCAVQWSRRPRLRACTVRSGRYVLHAARRLPSISQPAPPRPSCICILRLCVFSPPFGLGACITTRLPFSHPPTPASDRPFLSRRPRLFLRPLSTPVRRLSPPRFYATEHCTACARRPQSPPTRHPPRHILLRLSARF